MNLGVGGEVDDGVVTGGTVGSGDGVTTGVGVALGTGATSSQSGNLEHLRQSVQIFWGSSGSTPNLS